MLASYARRELLRNPRRTFTSLVGVTLGVALFTAVLFFTDGSSASMTQRAVAPLALDMQRVVAGSQGADLRLASAIAPGGALAAGETARVTLTLRNAGAVPANEVVVNDSPPAPLTYVMGSTTRDGRPLADVGGKIPLAQGLAQTGLNLGTVAPGRTVRFEYEARATQAVPATGRLRLGATVSTRENVVPARANQPAQLGISPLRARIARIPGVAAADTLGFVDLPPGSLSAGGAPLDGPVRVFAFDRRYQQHYPSVRLVDGGFARGSSLLSVEAARALGARVGGRVALAVPGLRTPLALPVSGLADLSRAKPLFYSRQGTKLEDFLYVPSSVVVDPRTFRRSILPAFRAATTARGAALKSRPVQEIDVLVDRARLVADPATALGQSRQIARAVRRLSPGQDYLIDNLSNTLAVASEDGAVAKRMFLFLGLPGALLAAILTAYAGGVLAAAARREQANLRIRGADGRHLMRLLAYRTVAIAGAGSVLGTAMGLVSALLVLGPAALFEASSVQLVGSAALGVTAGLVATGLALYVPGRRSLRREISQDRGEMSLAPAPAWQRLHLDLPVIVVALVVELVALRLGAFDSLPGSVYLGRAVSLPAYLMLGPVLAWVAGALLVARGMRALLARLPLPTAPRFGSPVSGILRRSLRRRSWTSAAGIVTVGLVVAFGANLAIFGATYDAAKAADARHVLGADLRVTPSVQSTQPHSAEFASQLQVPGVSSVTSVVFGLENSVLTGPYNQDREDLAAIDPRSFRRTSSLPDSSFVAATAAEAMSALNRERRGLLVNETTADDLQVDTGDTVEVLFARGTKHQSLVSLHVVALFTTLPGFPQGVDLVANLGYYQESVGTTDVDFFLADTDRHDAAGHLAAAQALQSGPGARDALTVDTTETALDKDQSSLTALNVAGLLQLDSVYTLLLAAAGIAIFVFGLLLARRREYVTLSALGMRGHEIQTLVLVESALVTVGACIAGLLVGTGMAALLVHVLRPLFILDPGMVLPVARLAILAGLAVGAALLSAVAASEVLRRLRPTELLREG
ncbi:MAG: FtsX-like permease family protein [Sporichthyaceae bacterium]